MILSPAQKVLSSPPSNKFPGNLILDIPVARCHERARVSVARSRSVERGTRGDGMTDKDAGVILERLSRMDPRGVLGQ